MVNVVRDLVTLCRALRTSTDEGRGWVFQTTKPAAEQKTKHEGSLLMRNQDERQGTRITAAPLRGSRESSTTAAKRDT